jgi:hypothetical protein
VGAEFSWGNLRERQYLEDVGLHREEYEYGSPRNGMGGGGLH